MMIYIKLKIMLIFYIIYIFQSKNNSNTNIKMSFIKENLNNLPVLEYDNGKFRLTGKSIPLNKHYFNKYIQILKKKLNKSKENIILEIDLEITNAYTNRKLAELIYFLDSIRDNSKKITIKWYCNSQNENIKELGHLLKNLTSLNFEIIEK